MHPLQYTMKIPPSNVSSVPYETQISQSGCSLPIKSVQVLFPDLRYLCLPSLRKYPSFFKNPAYAPSFVNLSWFTSSSPYHVTYQNKSLYVFSWLNYIFFVNGVLSFVCIHTQYTKSALTKYFWTTEWDPSGTVSIQWEPGVCFKTPEVTPELCLWLRELMGEHVCRGLHPVSPSLSTAQRTRLHLQFVEVIRLQGKGL